MGNAIRASLQQEAKIMLKRREFTKAQKLEMFKRAGGPENLRCEGCGLLLMGKPFEYDHTIECWERNDASAPLTAEDGWVLGKNCCHQKKSATKAGERAHGNRLIEQAARAKPRSRPMPGSRASAWKRKMDGTLVKREI
jgi:hypothetical protein